MLWIPKKEWKNGIRIHEEINNNSINNKTIMYIFLYNSKIYILKRLHNYRLKELLKIDPILRDQ